MLSNLFLMRKRFVTFEERELYCYRTDLLQMLSKVFLMSNILVAFAEGVTNAEQVVVHEQLISYFCITDLLVLLSRQLFLHFVNSNFLQESKQICSAKVTKFSAKVTNQFCKRKVPF